jgi:hypothetical protein
MLQNVRTDRRRNTQMAKEVNTHIRALQNFK